MNQNCIATQVNGKLPKLCDQGCLKKNYLHFTPLIMTRSSQHNPILDQRKKIFQKFKPAAVESFLMLILDEIRYVK